MSRRLQRLFASVGATCTFPVRKLRAWLNHWQLGRLFDRSLGGVSSVLSRIMRFEGQDYARHEPDGQIVMRTWPSTKTLSNPLWWFAWLFSFIWRWFLSRPFLPMVLAAPAVIFVAGLITMSTAGAGISRGGQSIPYRRLLASSLAAGQFDRARLAAEALARLNPNSVDNAISQAMVEEQAGDIDSARALMTDLAVSNKSAVAALWLANSIGDIDDFKGWNDAQRKEYFRWLTLASQNDPTNPLPRRLLGDLLRFIGDYRGAYAQLLPIADSDSEAAYIVTFLEKQLGLMEQARSRAESLQRIYADRLSANPQDFDARTQYVAMLFLMERESEALSVLQEGLAVATEPEQVRTLKSGMAEAMVLQAQQIAQKDSSPRGLIQSLERLRQAMAIDATNPALLEAVVQACLKAAESKDDELTVLREAIVQGVAPDTAHFILGTIALNSGNTEEAMQHLEIAVKNNPNLPGLLNNLAYAIASEEDADLERALRLSEAAVTTLPNHTYLRETRGQIYFRLKRYPEAIADLEFALASPELRPRIRESLAIAYEEMGQTEIAKRQRELLKAGK
ncbi:MAG: tetratricopeptide repeat protein [Pirellulaceae bacterium]